VAQQNPADVAACRPCLWRATVEATRTALVGKIGENMSIRRFVRIEAKGKVASYIHGGAKIGVLVDVVGGDETLAKDLAMHIAASKPKALDASGVPADLLDAERRIAVEKAREAGKPEAMLEKIAEGTVQKFLKEVTLLGQVFVKAEDGKQTIEQLLKAKGASLPLHALRGGRGHREEGRTTSPPKWLPRQPLRLHAEGNCPTARLQAHPAQAVGRGPHGQRRLRHQPGNAGGHRRRDQVGRNPTWGSRSAW
jgi:hypothetical protein